MQVNQKECRRCGTCCSSGGPALHSEDRALVFAGHIARAQLITIRKGELVLNPLNNTLVPAKQELIKISGVGRDWKCLYFDPEENGCIIYARRPQACKVLKCWETSEIEALFAKDTLNRADLIDPDDPLRPFVDEHERRFPCPDMGRLQKSRPSGKTLDLDDLANNEVMFRSAVIAKFDISLGEELFYFGRPIFHLFISVGAKVVEADNRLIITWPKRSAADTGR